MLDTEKFSSGVAAASGDPDSGAQKADLLSLFESGKFQEALTETFSMVGKELERVDFPDVVRRSPWLSVGAALAAGFAVSRLAKSPGLAPTVSALETKLHEALSGVMDEALGAFGAERKK